MKIFISTQMILLSPDKITGFEQGTVGLSLNARPGSVTNSEEQPTTKSKTRKVFASFCIA